MNCVTNKFQHAIRKPHIRGFIYFELLSVVSDLRFGVSSIDLLSGTYFNPIVGIPYTDMEEEISVSIVTHWDTRVVAALYRAGGWWKEEWDPADLTSLMRSSFAFAIAHTTHSRQAVGMGRVISDGVSDAYIQDLVVIPGWRGKGVGKQILSSLIAYCHVHRITWIGLIAEPGTMEFYTSMGFSPLKGYIPMKFNYNTLNQTPSDTEHITSRVANHQEKRPEC